MKNCLCGFAENSTKPSIVPSKGETNQNDQNDQKSFSNSDSRLEPTEQKQSKDTRKMPAGHLVDAVKNRDINAAKSLLEEVRFVFCRFRKRVCWSVGPPGEYLAVYMGPRQGILPKITMTKFLSLICVFVFQNMIPMLRILYTKWNKVVT